MVEPWECNRLAIGDNLTGAAVTLAMPAPGSWRPLRPD